MSFTRFYDPDGDRHGVPTWPWGHAPAHLATRGQLAAYGLRPGAAPAGQIMWRSRRARPGGVRTAQLYDTTTARPKRPCTPAMRAALEAAMRARRTCRREFAFCLPTSLGCCPDCHHRTERSST